MVGIAPGGGRQCTTFHLDRSRDDDVFSPDDDIFSPDDDNFLDDDMI